MLQDAARAKHQSTSSLLARLRDADAQAKAYATEAKSWKEQFEMQVIIVFEKCSFSCAYNSSSQRLLSFAKRLPCMAHFFKPTLHLD